MSKEEHDEQQWYYKVGVMDPHEMGERFKNTQAKNSEEDEERRQKIEELQIKLIGLIRAKFQTCLTKRQKEVIELYLISKKQEHMGQILSITQEAVFSRLSLAFKRLRKACNKDPEIQNLLKEIKKT